MSTEPETPSSLPAEGHPLSRLEATLLGFGAGGELLALMVRGGRWWMLVLMLVLVVLAVVMLALQAAQYVAPFVYMVF